MDKGLHTLKLPGLGEYCFYLGGVRFEIGYQVRQADLKTHYVMEDDSLNILLILYLYLPSAKVTCVHHHAFQSHSVNRRRESWDKASVLHIPFISATVSPQRKSQGQPKELEMHFHHLPAGVPKPLGKTPLLPDLHKQLRFQKAKGGPVLLRE